MDTCTQKKNGQCAQVGFRGGFTDLFTKETDPNVRFMGSNGFWGVFKGNTCRDGFTVGQTFPQMAF